MFHPQPYNPHGRCYSYIPQVPTQKPYRMLEAYACHVSKLRSGEPICHLQALIRMPMVSKNSKEHPHWRTVSRSLRYVRIWSALRYMGNHRGNDYVHHNFDIQFWILIGFSPRSQDLPPGLWTWASRCNELLALPTSFKAKKTVDTSKSDRELFEELPLDDVWEDAKLVDVYFYLRASKKTRIPDTWVRVFEELDTQLASYRETSHS